MNTVSLSIIIPIFNSFTYIDKTIESVIESCKDYIYEIILVDDCSTDIQSVERLIKKYAYVSIIKKEEKTNAAHSRNLGFNNSKYNFVFFLDSDDHYTNEYVNNRLVLMKENVAGVYFGGFVLNLKDKKKVNFFRDYSNEDIRNYIFMKGGDFRTSTISIDKKHHKGTLFDPLQFKHQDWGFGIRCYDAGEHLIYDKNTLVIVNYGMNEQMSNAMNIPASRYFVDNYLLDRKYYHSFANMHLLNAFKNKDTTAIEYFLGLIKESGKGLLLVYFYVAMLYFSKNKINPLVIPVIKVYLKIK